MSFKINALCIFAISSIFCETKTWDGSISGTSWNYAEHWSPPTTPTALDIVKFETIPKYPKKEFVISIIAPSVAAGLEFDNQNEATSYHLFGKVPLRLESESSITIQETNKAKTNLDVPLLVVKDTDVYNKSLEPLLLEGTLLGKEAHLRLHGPGSFQIGGEEDNTFSGEIEIHNTNLLLNKQNGKNAIATTAKVFSGELKGDSIAKSGTISLIGATGSAKWALERAEIRDLLLDSSNHFCQVSIEDELSISNALKVSNNSKIEGRGTLFLTEESSIQGVDGTSVISTNVDIGGTRPFVIDASSLIIDGKISNGSLVKKGDGILDLRGENTYADTLIEEGTLQASTKNIPGNVHVLGTLAIEQNFDGKLKGNLIGEGTLLKKGEGLLDFSENTPFSGSAIVQEGFIKVNSEVLTGDLQVESLALFDQEFDGVANCKVTGSGTLLKEGPGTITFSKNSPFSGVIEIKQGGIEGTTESIQGHLFNRSMIAFDQEFNGTHLGTIAGNGVIHKRGGGALILDKKNSHEGTFYLDAGKLVLGHSEALGKSNLKVSNKTILGFAPNIAVENDIELSSGVAALNIPMGKSSVRGTLQGEKFVKTGAGSLEIQKGVFKDLSLVGGGLEVGGSVVGNVDVDTEGLLTGTGRIVGQVTSRGTISGGRILEEKTPFDTEKAEEFFLFEQSFEEEIAPSTDLYLIGDKTTKSVSGKATVSGDVHLDPESLLLINFNPNSFSQIEVDGTIQLNSSTLALEPFAGTYKVGTNYKIIEAKNIEGEFGEVVTPFAMLNPIVSYNQESGNVSVFFEMTTHHFSDLFKRGNAGQVAKCLDYFSEHPCDGSATVIQALTNTSSQSEINKALLQMQPSQLTSLAVVQQNDLFYVRNAVYQRLFESQKSCTMGPFPSNSPVSFWGSFFGGYTTQESQGGDPGYIAQTPGVIFGVDREIKEGTSLGGALSYAYTYHEWNKSRGDARIHNIYASCYGQYVGERGYIEGSLLGGYSFYDVERKTTFGPFSSTQAIAKSNFGGKEGSIDLRTGLRYAFDQFSVNPFVGLDYMLVSHNSFTEVGAKALNLKVKSNVSDLLTSEGGVQFDFCQRKDATFLKGFLRLSAIVETRFFGEKQSSSFACNGCSMQTQGFYPTRVLGGLGMGLSAAFGNNVFEASYQGKSQWEFTDQSLTFQYLWKF